MEFNKPKLTIGEIISNSFKLVIDNALEILKITGIFLVPVYVLIGVIIVIAAISILGMGSIGFLSTTNAPSESEIASLIFTMIIPLMIFIILVSLISLAAYFGYGIIIKVLSDKYCEEETDWKYSMKYVWQKKWSLLGMNLLIILISTVIYIIIIILSGVLTAVTFGIGLLIVIPIIIGFAILVPSIIMLCNSMLIIKDVNATDSIKQTLKLFKKGYFWNMVGKCAALYGVTLLIGIGMMIVGMIPFLGMVVVLIGQIYVKSFLMAACSIIVIDDMESEENFTEGMFIE